MLENEAYDQKSLKAIQGSNADWDELAKDCVAFANAHGGEIIIGIEDRKSLPPKEQRVDESLMLKTKSKLLGLTINISLLTEIRCMENGGEVLVVKIPFDAHTIAATTSGKYFLRVGDNSKPVMPEALMALTTQKASIAWETMTSMQIPLADCDLNEKKSLLKGIRVAEVERVSSFIKQKSDIEILEYYSLINGKYLTSLGVIWLGTQRQRAMLVKVPTVQYIKFDEQGRKVRKIAWDDYTYSPLELVETIWTGVDTWKESLEVSIGLFRENIPFYDEKVIRELLINAIAHRSYALQGDIFINEYPDHIEIHSPGSLPMGVTPQNILHKSAQRNPHFTTLCRALGLMEKEGSGYDLIYEVMLKQAKPIPEVTETSDRVVVTLKKQIQNPQIVMLLEKLANTYQLAPREIITLGIVAQHEILSAVELTKVLQLPTDDKIADWIGSLVDKDILKVRGKTKGTKYLIDRSFLKDITIGQTTLKTIEPHRLKELIRHDLEQNGTSSISVIHSRIGKEISLRSIRVQIDNLRGENIIQKTGTKRWTKYTIKTSIKI